MSDDVASTIRQSRGFKICLMALRALVIIPCQRGEDLSRRDALRARHPPERAAALPNQPTISQGRARSYSPQQP